MGCSASPKPKVGVVIGHIDACSGLPQAARYVAGSIVALLGVISTQPAGNGENRTVLPPDEVGHQRVSTGGEYRFALPPGNYVIDLPHYDGGNVGSFVSVVIHAGATVDADLPNTCK
jgi:hypothetical protein